MNREEYVERVAGLWKDYDNQKTILYKEHIKQLATSAAPLIAEHRAQKQALWDVYWVRWLAIEAGYDVQ